MINITRQYLINILPVFKVKILIKTELIKMVGDED